MKIYSKTHLPLGFKANGISAGIKKSGKPDLGLIFSEVKCRAAAVFTTNAFMAAPVRVSKDLLRRNKFFQGVIVNSGNANCFTGQSGLKNAWRMVEATSKMLDLKAKNIFVASTGIIGRQLPIEKILGALPRLVRGLSASGIDKFSQSIQTTDKFKKEISVKAYIKGKEITLCGVCKGAGMIFPHLATMLCFILTDLNIEKNALEKALRIAVADSFNSISIDGCQSTNDTVLILANGQAANRILTGKDRDYKKFLSMLKFVCLNLAKTIVKDGEGATKIIRIDVHHAKSKEEAKRVGFLIANSNLFKTAIYGEDPNWGRVVQAVGVSGLKIKERDLKINFSALDKKEVRLKVSLGRGNKSATVYTSDLTPAYIKINSQYN
ncbi:MAG: bifunctional glutamate N-acetyltransferase/amino-acid acetyltransferase ArgJ [Candidatus Omnitrophica bacterium]|nr:bifunctional glutamate N-acetyltransferase/amino-acid acetyltransferase ArgJ [Candidatus Omnitrophota bacterium]